MLKVEVKEKEKKEDVNKLTEGTWNLSYQAIIINFMLIGLVSLRFQGSMRFLDF